MSAIQEIRGSGLDTLQQLHMRQVASVLAVDGRAGLA